MSIAYPPEMLPKADEPAEVIVVDPKDTCRTCQHFAPLAPGHAAICYERWRSQPWNAAVPLTTADDHCEKHEKRK